MEAVTFGVLGAVTAARDAHVLALKGPRHRAVLARLILARRRVVPLARLVEDLWEAPPPRAVGAVRTFVGDLRRALEPDRPPRAPARLLVTEGPGYALRAAPDAVDAWRFEAAVAQADRLPAAQAPDRLRAALGEWRGPAYAEFGGEDWTRGERSRLTELRLRAVERRAELLVDLGRAAEAVPDLDAHLTEHPWREESWRLLALALYRSGRQADALAVLRRARALLAGHLGIDPGPRLRRLEAGILAQDPDLDPPGEPAEAAARLWARATEAYDRTVAAGAHARLESTVGLLRSLAVTGGGGLEAAREHRMTAVAAAEETGDAELTARVIGAYDVPANWTRSDDPELAGRIVAAAERTLAALPEDPSADAARCRLLATVALESRGVRSPRGPRAAAEAERTARRLDDPALLAFALNGVFMQSCTGAGLAPRRDAIGAELVALGTRHGLVNYAVLGRLIRLQARSALADLTAADEHATAVDRLAERHERPLVAVFTQWYRALREAASGSSYDSAEAAYRSAAARLDGAGMPGLERGLLPLALLGLRLAHGRPADVDPDAQWGPYRPWAEPFALLAEGRDTEARTALRALPEPPPDLLYEALCCAEAALALELGDTPALERTYARLLPASGELAGAGSGLLTFGPVDGWLAAIRGTLEA
ncbi:BTAD domain-containing putative transcriptional regulator [Streptomyces sp. AC512_CC834]|uniref:AfsR/SARP family transcriptional regulator n=1 Tax=Streptomyces sp. AC512_CC834 TaxID=2823691 RepID=UPI001C27CD3A|nr:BTAD domain-containing putative transcriptional regulator [Streptomyces sp. AC512_CC834]